MSRTSTVFLPAVLSLLLACNGGKNNSIEGVPDVVSEQTPGSTGAAEGATTAPAPVYEMTPEMIDARVSEAAAWLTTGQPDQANSAITALKELSVEAPDLAEIPYNMGVAYEILGDDTEARKRYLRATDIDPSLGEAWLNLGALAERGGDLNRALQAYRAGLRNAPDNPDLIVGVIGVLRKLGQHDAAISEARAALAKNANNVNAYNNLGLVYIEQGNLDLAQFIYQKALADIVGAELNALIHANLGQVFLLQDKTANARLEFERALELEPDLVVAKMFLAQLHMDNRDWDATATVLEDALKVEPNNPAIHVNLGIAYRGQGQLEKAQSSYEKALELEPSNPDPYLNLAILFSDHMQAYDAALQALETYQSQGGTRTDLVTQWDEDIRKEQKKYERAQERKQRREESKKREELARQAEEREAAEVAEEAARQVREEAAQPPEAPPEEAPPEEAPPAETTPEEAPPAETTPAGSGSETTPWGGEGAQSASVDEILQAGSGGIIGAGESCSALSSCGSPALECGNSGACQEAGTQGAFPLGVSCSMDTDCAFGLACVSQVCNEPPGAQTAPGDGTDTPWGP
jgi:tetratricopeptide (TPR) repeat protein